MDRFDNFAGHRPIVVIGEQKLREAQYARHRRSQFVRRGRQEFTLHAIDLPLSRHVAQEQHPAAQIAGRALHASQRARDRALLRSYQLDLVRIVVAEFAERGNDLLAVAEIRKDVVETGDCQAIELLARRAHHVAEGRIAVRQTPLYLERGETVRAELEDRIELNADALELVFLVAAFRYVLDDADSAGNVPRAVGNRDCRLGQPDLSPIGRVYLVITALRYLCFARRDRVPGSGG